MGEMNRTNSMRPQACQDGRWSQFGEVGELAQPKASQNLCTGLKSRPAARFLWGGGFFPPPLIFHRMECDTGRVIK